MTEKISLALVDESKNVVIVDDFDTTTEARLDSAMISITHNIKLQFEQFKNAEMRVAEKFRFVKRMADFLEETKSYEPF